ncbi:hypothetical protein CEXT_759971 [Caerostris extrusa]|uniref:Uncharacterized protein n=1 Tax=Caerostris extrusa TaxID=172846 RepID=A0AAV4WRV8_CAEEX|nr:hypothetical protein CEXT_759971 [Caerostris extrusa]
MILVGMLGQIHIHCNSDMPQCSNIVLVVIAYNSWSLLLGHVGCALILQRLVAASFIRSMLLEIVACVSITVITLLTKLSWWRQRCNRLIPNVQSSFFNPLGVVLDYDGFRDF